MGKKILTVGYQIPGQSDDYLAFDSKMSLIDADLVIFSPTIDARYGLDNDYQGKTTYSQTGSFRLKEDLSHWRQELTDFSKSGRNIIVLLAPKTEFFLHTGEKTFSGTGKSRVTTNIVDLHDNYESLPVALKHLTLSHGKEIVPVANLNKVFEINEPLKSRVQYRVYFRADENASTLYTTKDKSRIIAAIVPNGAGNLVFLPYLPYEEQEFTETKVIEGEEVEQWNKQGIVFGQALINLCLKIDAHLDGDSPSTPPPEWSKKEAYVLSQELSVQGDITTKVELIEKLRSEKSELELQLTDIGELRGLLYETGKSLERAVIKALKLLGYDAEGYDDGQLELDQVIASPEGMRYVGECEGKDNKPINIDKLRQLIESMNADFARDEVEEKAYGILFGNPNRLKDPSDREEWFTQKCTVGAKREGISLVKTPDLFVIAQYLIDNPDPSFAAQCRKAIKDSLGEIVIFPEIPHFASGEQKSSVATADKKSRE